MKIEIWFDFVCPFCYLGDAKFEKALARFEHRDEVEVVFRSFQLNMDNVNTKGKDIHQVVADKYHITYAQSKANNDRIAEAGKEVGLHYDFDHMKLNGTLLAHKIMQYAKRENKEHALIERYFKEYFENGMDIGSQEELLQIAGELGLDMKKLNLELAGDGLKIEVQKDEAAARNLGIDTIPHFMIDGKHAATGAQEEEYFLEILKKAYGKISVKAILPKI